MAEAGKTAVMMWGTKGKWPLRRHQWRNPIPMPIIPSRPTTRKPWPWPFALATPNVHYHLTSP